MTNVVSVNGRVCMEMQEFFYEHGINGTRGDRRVCYRREWCHKKTMDTWYEREKITKSDYQIRLVLYTGQTSSN